MAKRPNNFPPDVANYVTELGLAFAMIFDEETERWQMAQWGMSDEHCLIGPHRILTDGPMSATEPVSDKFSYTRLFFENKADAQRALKVIVLSATLKRMRLDGRA